MTPATNSTNPWIKFIPDTIVLVLYIVLLDPLMSWQARHLSLSCILLILLNTLAMALGCFSFFCNYADMKNISAYAKQLNSFEGAVTGISTLLSCLGFLWWLVPFAGAKKMGVEETYFFLGMTLYFILFMAIVAKAISYHPGFAIIGSTGFKMINSLVNILFFFFSYGFLTLTLRNWQPGFIAAPYLGILCLFIFYLPLRFFLLLRPPFHKLEYPLFIISFGYMLFRLFA